MENKNLFSCSDEETNNDSVRITGPVIGDKRFMFYINKFGRKTGSPDQNQPCIVTSMVENNDFGLRKANVCPRCNKGVIVTCISFPATKPIEEIPGPIRI
ncbi:MAG TPA: hypothetical protein VI819_00690 [Patescibacteria group bacterium]|nr:hypothetical protein [Patescibacteria group bacterium]